MAPPSNLSGTFRHLAVLAALGLVVAGCGAAPQAAAPTQALPSVAATTVANPTPGSTPVASVTQSLPPTAAPTPPETLAPATDAPPTAAPPTAAPGIGVAIHVGDQQLMTVVQAEGWPGASGVKPRSGKAFFTVSIRIDALGVTSFDSADFRLKDAAGKIFAWRTGRSPHLYDLDNMTPGNNYVGWITYEIPKASLVGLTLIYNPSFMGGTTFAVPVS